MMEVKKLHDTDLLLTKKYLYITCIYCCYFPIFLYSGGYVLRGLCLQGVLSAGGFIQGVMSAGGFVLDSSYPYIGH